MVFALHAISDISNIIPYIGSALGVVLLVVGRFIWRTHIQSKGNASRLDRYGRTLFGDEDDARHDGLARTVDNLDNRVDRLEDQIDRIERKIDLLCEFDE